MPMLEWKPEKRATAQQMLRNPWLLSKCNEEYKMNEKEHSLFIQKSQFNPENAIKISVDKMGESADEEYDADSEYYESDSDKENEEVANEREYLLFNDHGPNQQFLPK